MMRQLWASEIKLDWDDPVPEACREDWVKFFSDLFDMNNIKFERCLKPANAIGDPTLVIFSDGCLRRVRLRRMGVGRRRI